MTSKASHKKRAKSQAHRFLKAPPLLSQRQAIKAEPKAKKGKAPKKSQTKRAKNEIYTQKKDKL